MRIDKNIEIAQTPPSSFYTSQAIFEKSKAIFENSYQFIHHKSELDNISCYPFNLFENWIDIPLLITKEKEQIICLSNVCTHRGNILCKEPFNKNKIVCDYHGRNFNLDGTINHAPGFKKTKNFPSENDNLNKDIKLINWNGLLFVNTGQNKAILNGLNQIDRKSVV